MPGRCTSTQATDFVLLPAHWEKAAKRQGVVLRSGEHGRRIALMRLEEPRKIWGQKVTHLLLKFSSRPMKNWGENKLFTDLLNPEYLTTYGFSPDEAKTVEGLIDAYIELALDPVPKKDFHSRYPDVPYAQAHDFVLLHEIGHTAQGAKESAADKYAFARLLLPQHPESQAMREIWYAKIKDPFAPWTTRAT